jgi:anti-anti-sigma factor
MPIPSIYKRNVDKPGNMKIKTDTKEKFHAITVSETQFSADMAAELTELLLPLLQNDGSPDGNKTKNVILNLKELTSIDEVAGEKLVKLQQNFYEQNASFVICGLQAPVETSLDTANLLELMNTTPTESEAWDIVQMEEIERELMDGED